MLAHVWINHENLHYIASFDPRDPRDDAPSAPRLVNRHERR
jgi:hypothetical protein